MEWENEQDLEKREMEGEGKKGKGEEVMSKEKKEWIQSWSLKCYVVEIS